MLTNDRRIARIRSILDQRLHHVAIAVEALHHRHNVSAILRTADSLGIHRVHLVEGHFRAVRGAARGAERWLDLHTHSSPELGVEAIHAAGYRIYCADLDEHAVTPEQVPVDRPICLWFGAELVGVHPVVREACEGVVSVPMRGFAQSLNVSVAAAVTMRPVAERARSLGPEALLPEEEREALWHSWMRREELKYLRGRAGPT